MTLYPAVPQEIKDAIFSQIIVHPTCQADKDLNDFLLDVINSCEREFIKHQKEKV